MLSFTKAAEIKYKILSTTDLITAAALNAKAKDIEKSLIVIDLLQLLSLID